MSLLPAALTDFELPERLCAGEPPEVRGIGRGQVRMLVADGPRVFHRRFDDLPAYLAAGDLVVFNTSATVPAAVDGALPQGRPVVVHFATALDDGTWVVEVRPAVRAQGPVAWLAIGARATLLTAYPDVSQPASRLWRAAISAADVHRLLFRYGRPITYGYKRNSGPWGSTRLSSRRTPAVPRCRVPGAHSPPSS